MKSKEQLEDELLALAVQKDRCDHTPEATIVEIAVLRWVLGYDEASPSERRRKAVSEKIDRVRRRNKPPSSPEGT